MVKLIPSVLIMGIVLTIIFDVFIMLFLPLIPLSFTFLPGIILVGVVYLVYRLAKKKKTSLSK